MSMLQRATLRTCRDPHIWTRSGTLLRPARIRVSKPSTPRTPISHNRQLPLQLRQLRHSSASTVLSESSPTSSRSAILERKPWRPAPHRDPNEPVYELYFTCKACKHRSGHTISKQGYHKGTVLIKCDGCNNRHLISDHLRVFSDTPVTLEDILARQGHAVKHGGIDQEGDIELWEDAASGDSTKTEAKKT